MAQLGVIERAKTGSSLVPAQAEPAEPSYIGVTTAFGKTVFIGDKEGLQTLRLGGSALTTGYTWGRAGPGPREVARAILIDATGNEMLAERLCRPFTWEVVSKLPADEFCITRADVLAWSRTHAA
ncbi:MAG TPA: DUF6166 domain-containing protein [Solirubrobacterales bacterium]